MWSAGVILFIMLSGEPPFSGKDDAEILKKVSQGAFSFDKPRWKHVSAAAKDLICKLMEMDPTKRPSAADAMDHPWFEIKKSKVGADTDLRESLSNMRKFHVDEC